MSQHEFIKKTLQRKFEIKNQHNFDDFYNIMEPYARVLWDNDTNYKSELNKIFNDFIIDNNGYVNTIEIVSKLTDIISSMLFNNNNEINNISFGIEYNNDDYINEIHSLKKVVKGLRQKNENLRREFEVCKLERNEYKKSHELALNQLNVTKINENEIKNDLKLIRHHSNLMVKHNNELYLDYDTLKIQYIDSQKKCEMLQNDIKSIKILNDELKNVNKNFVTINNNINKRCDKIENENKKLRELLTDIQNHYTNKTHSARHSLVNLDDVLEGDTKIDDELMIDPDNLLSEPEFVPNRQISSPNARRIDIPNMLNGLKSKSYHSRRGSIELYTQLMNYRSTDVESNANFEDNNNMDYMDKIRKEIRDEITLEYTTKLDQIRIQTKIKLTDKENYYQNKLKIFDKQSKEEMLNLQNSIDALNNVILKYKKKLIKIENDIKNNRYADEHENKSVWCQFLWY